jgi:nucleotide-binding universal stress UspA family protein
MKRIKHILFPIDYSERCCCTVPFVEAMASHYDADVTLISVAQPFLYAGMGDPGGPVMISSDLILEDLKDRLDHALTREYAHLRVHRVAELGEASRVITEFAHANNVDLIMMPTHGYGPFRELLLGSVTAKVLHDATCPVWTAAHIEEAPCKDHLACKSVLCAIDGTPSSIGLMKTAAQLAADLGATLRLVHVITGVERSSVHTFEVGYDQQLRDAVQQKIQEMQTEANIHAPLCLVAGTVAEGVQEEARRHSADLLVIGRGALHEKLGRLRAHSYAIIRESPCPVLSV